MNTQADLDYIGFLDADLSTSLIDFDDLLMLLANYYAVDSYID